MAAAVFIAGAAISAYGQFQQGQAIQDQAEAEQDILNYNASIKDKEAKAALERGRAEALKFQREASRTTFRTTGGAHRGL